MDIPNKRISSTVLIFGCISICLATTGLTGYDNDDGAGGIAAHKVIYAVNAGGVGLVDSNGIEYITDPYLNTNIGIASDYGRRFMTIGRTSSANDAFLYQTERYGLDSFAYKIPIENDGAYVLVLKFSEVYFMNPGRKIFDVKLNNQLVLEELDIFKHVGHAVAHDEYVPFKVTGNGKHLIIDGEKSHISKGSITLEFVKGPKDNPKINAFYVIRGDLNGVPKLPPYDSENPFGINEEEPQEPVEDIYDEDGNRYINIDDDDESSSSEVPTVPSRRSKRSTHTRSRIYDPYEIEDDSWDLYVPIFVAFIAAMVIFFVVRLVVGRSL